MSLKQLPELNASKRQVIQSYLSPAAFGRWQPSISAAAGESTDNTISILDVIGEDWWTGEGVTSKRIAGALRAIGERDIVVNVNSPGGDMFEGIAIYNMLREHKAKVTINVLGIAASAASVIAMSGDEIRIGRPSFLMIHNCWCLAAGNRHDFAEMAEYMEPFDAAMADVYHARTGIDAKEIQTLMDKESWIGGSAAVERGFADALLDDQAINDKGGGTQAAAVRRIEAALRGSGMPRSEAQRLLSEFKSSLSDSAGNGGLSDSAAKPDAALLQNLLTTFKGQKS